MSDKDDALESLDKSLEQDKKEIKEDDKTKSLKPGHLRIIISDEYLIDCGETLDEHFKNNADFSRNVENRVQMFHRVSLNDALKEYSKNELKMDWDTYLAHYRGKILDTIKYENRIIVKLNEKTQEENYKGAFLIAKARTKSEENKKILLLSEKITKAFHDNREALKTPLGKDFVLLETMVQAYSFPLGALGNAKNEVEKMKSCSKIKEITDEILKDYPIINDYIKDV